MAAKRMPRVGCAGWSIPAADRARFGPGDSVLERYATRFNAVEINSSFYRPHQRATYARWAAAVPRGFRFSVKLPKAISHERRLQASGPPLDEFVGQIQGLGMKLGSLLLQLPPGLAFDAKVAANFFAMLGRRTGVPMACEPRHPSWNSDKASDLLQRFGIGRVSADPDPCPQVPARSLDARLEYWRWHGSPRIYYSSYEDAELRRLESAVRSAPQKTEPWIIFDNTAHGHATGNALRLQELLAEPVARKERR
jgi:uncharacterized protein YecE (DUF72 family)